MSFCLEIMLNQVRFASNTYCIVVWVGGTHIQWWKRKILTIEIFVSLEKRIQNTKF